MPESSSPPPPGWGPPAYPVAGIEQERPTNRLAVWSMVSGILGLVLLILWPISWIGSVVALVLGFTSRRQIRERSEGGDGYSIAGIALGFVGGAVWVVAVGIIALVFLLGTFVKSAFVQTCDAFPPEGTAAASC